MMAPPRAVRAPAAAPRGWSAVVSCPHLRSYFFFLFSFLTSRSLPLWLISWFGTARTPISHEAAAKKTEMASMPGRGGTAV
jgi:hypothetical protein